MRLFALLLILALAGPVHAAWTDDIPNNVASDIAPLIALFGDKVLLHWLSQSLSYVEVVMLAVCPIGVPAIISSAIRLTGHQVAKNLIGRPRESRAAVEAELTPVTSAEVSECWDGERVVRTTGEADMQEFFILKRIGGSGSGTGVAVKKLSECVGTHLEAGKALSPRDEILKLVEHVRKFFLHLPRSDVEHGHSSHTTSSSTTPNSTPTSSGEPELLIIKNDKNTSPNLSLNLQSHLNRPLLYLSALLSLAIQGISLSFPRMLADLGFPLSVKNGQPVPPWAETLYVSGSSGLFFFSFVLCCIVVKSTKKVVYRPINGWQMERLVWLQSKAIINDQHFLPYAIYPKDQHDYVITSERATRLNPPAEERSWTLRLGLSSALCCTVSSIMCVASFAIQLTGLRLLHPFLQILHISCLVFMIVVRSCFSHHLSKQPDAVPLIPEHEMDWLAMVVQNGVGNFPWSEKTKKNTHEEPGSVDRPWGSLGGFDWTPPKWKDLNGCQPLVPNGHLQADTGTTKAQSALKARRGMAQAAGRRGPLAEFAVSVAQAVEGTLNTLSSSGEAYFEPDCKSFLWNLEDDGESQVQFLLSLVDNKQWYLPADELEALLSLMFFRIRYNDNQRERRPTSERHEDISSEAPVGHACIVKRDTWLRGRYKTFRAHRDDSTPAQGGPDLSHLLAQSQGLNLWFKEPFENARKFGFLGFNHEHSSTLCPEAFQGQDFCGLDKLNLFTRESVGSQEKAHAQHLFNLFMWSLAKTLQKPIGGETCVRLFPKPKTGSKKVRFAFSNSLVDRISTILDSSGLGHGQPSDPVILLPLLASDKLPCSQMFKAIKECAVSCTRKPVKQKLHVYKWAFYNLLKFPAQKSLFIMVAAALIEGFELKLEGTLHYEPTLKNQDELEDDYVAVIKATLNHLEDADQVVLSSLICLSEAHNRHIDNLLIAVFRAKKWNIRSELFKKPAKPSLLWQLTPLQRFCLQDGDRSDRAMTEIIQRNAKCIDATDSIGRTALHHAVQKNNMRLVQMLLEHGANADRADVLGRTPLHLGAHSNIGVVNALFNYSEGVVNMRDLAGLTPLHHATAWGNKMVMYRLLSVRGTNLQLSDNRGATFSHYIARYHKGAPIIGALPFFRNPDHDIHGRTPYHMAVMNPHIPLSEFSIIFDSYDTVEEEDCRAKTPLGLARRIMLQHGCGRVSVSKRHDAHFSGAFNSLSEQRGLEPISENPEDTPDPVPAHNLTPLHLYCLNGEDLSDNKIAEVIRANADDINAVDILGRTAIHYDIQREHDRKLELDPKEVLNVRDSNGLTPLHHVAAWGNLDVLEPLAETQAITSDTSDDGGAKPVNYCARYREADEIASVVKSEPGLMNMKTCDYRGRSGFHLAVINPKIKPDDIPKIFTLFMHFNYRDSFSETPLDLALRIWAYGCGHACSSACKDRMEAFVPRLIIQREILRKQLKMPKKERLVQGGPLKTEGSSSFEV
ncbi:unnamed protein product [Clonostachys rosea]|uniref:Uncharacterized protein n=1 Tax=Bionectria ochroleuca TaxID=29856 RepID=A0ABY6U1I4_BIOOC|nr:unnamed protein product [Clonostachys rosea]